MFIKQLAALLSLTTLALSAPVETRAFKHYSEECNINPGEYLKLSYTYGGDTVYYYNHCSEVVTIYYMDDEGDWHEVITADDKKKGSESVWHPIHDVTGPMGY